MSPFIRDGDVITVAPEQLSDRNPHVLTSSPLPAGRVPGVRTYGIGQVVAFVSPLNERLVVHRIIGRRESLFLIQGDNLPRPGADMIRREDILGRVVRIERGGKRVWIGLGPERYPIAILSRVGLLLPIRLRAGALTRFLRKPTNGDN
jgi:hypothetical protein